MSLFDVIYFGVSSVLLVYCLYCSTSILYNAYLGPLSKIPHAHFSAPLSSAWILWNKWQLYEHRARHEAHQRLGPVVRIGPRELSIDCIEDGVRTVYGSWEKHSWYTSTLQGNSAPYMLTMLSHSAHAQRRRLVATAYSKTSVMSNPRIQSDLQQIIDGDLMTRLWQALAASEPVEVLSLNKSVYLDLSTAWIFGSRLKTTFVMKEAERHKFFDAFVTGSADFFLRSEFASLTAFLCKLGLFKSGYDTFDQGSFMQTWISGLCAGAEAAAMKNEESKLPQGKHNTQTIFELLRQGLHKSNMTREEVDRALRAECLDHILASYDVSGVVLSYIMYELSLQPALRAKLRAEISSLGLPLQQPSPQEIDTLPLLDAILLETLRLHPSVLGPWPRLVPAAGARLGSFRRIPAGTKVSASSWTLHSHAEIFSQPDQWQPERWLQATKSKRAEMMRWMWPYGSGARICIGNHFANRSLKYTVVKVYRDFETEVDKHNGMEDLDSFFSGPAGDCLQITFKSVSDVATNAGLT